MISVILNLNHSNAVNKSYAKNNPIKYLTNMNSTNICIQDPTSLSGQTK